MSSLILPLLGCSLSPVISHSAGPQVMFTSVLFTTNTDCLLVGDSEGEVGVFELQNLAASDRKAVRSTRKCGGSQRPACLSGTSFLRKGLLLKIWLINIEIGGIRYNSITRLKSEVVPTLMHAKPLETSGTGKSTSSLRCHLITNHRIVYVGKAL